MASTTVSTGYNPYDLSSLYGMSSMAHDYFGSQAFGSGTYMNSSGAAPQKTQTSSVQTVETPRATEQSVQNIFEKPKTQASALLQEYAKMKEYKDTVDTADEASQDLNNAEQAANSSSQTTAATTHTANSAPTIQDYYMATLIANQFANNIPLIDTNTSFVNNDYFAGKAFSSNSSSSNNSSGISYTG